MNSKRVLDLMRVIAWRLLTLAATLLAVSALVFFLGRLFVPGDAATVIVGSEGSSAEQIAALRERLGLNKPLFEQYWSWVVGMLGGDFGVSPIHDRRVIDDIRSQFPASMQLAGIGLAMASMVGVVSGMIAALFKDRLVDNLLRATMLIVLSIPMFVFGILFVLITAIYFPALYTSRYVPWGIDPVANLRSLLLPSLALALPVAAVISQITRSAMLDVQAELFVDSARARGISRARIASVHMLKNAAPPIVTVIGFQFGLLLGGVVVIEEIFNLPGLGRGLLLALSQRDFPMLMAGTMTIAAVFVFANLLVDLLYPVLDPRQRA